MEIQIDNQYMLKAMKDFIDTPSPVGYYEEVLPVLEAYAKELGHEVTYDLKHTGYITLEGEDNSKTVCVGAHMDTIGLIIKRINDNGTIAVRSLGGVNFSSIEGESVTVHTRDGKHYTGLMTCTSHSVHVFDDARTLQRDEDSMVVLLDEHVSTKQDVFDLGIMNGDVISVDPRFQYTEKGFIKSRYLDDKAAVAAVFAVLKYLKETGRKPKYKTMFAFPFFEEIGHGGAYVPPEVTEYVAIDIGLVGPDYNGTEYKVSICVKDNFSPYDRELTSRLIHQAKAVEADYAIDIFYRYGTDANAAIRAGHNLLAAAFGMAVHSSHGMERCHISAVENTAKLLVGYVLDL